MGNWRRLLMLAVLGGALGTSTSMVGAASNSWRLEYTTPTEGRRPVLIGHDVAVNARGEAIVIWAGCDSRRMAIPEAPPHHCPELRSVARSARGGWRPIRTLLRSFVERPHVLLDRAGNGLALWIGGRYDRQELFAAVKARGKLGWSVPVDLAEGCEPIKDFDVAANEAGAVVVAWTCASSETWARVRSAQNHRWGPPREISDANDAFAFQPTVAIDERGNAVAAWVGCRSTCFVRTARFSRKVGVWGGRNQLTAGPHFAELEVVMNGDGAALAVWLWESPNGPERLEAAVGPAGRPWARPTTLWRAPTRMLPQDFRKRVSAAASSGGGFAVAWAAGQSIQARMRFPGGRWGPIRMLAERHSANPRLVAGSRAGFVVAWSRLEGVASLETASVSARGLWARPRTAAIVPLLTTFEVSAEGARSVLAWIELLAPTHRGRLRIAAS
jgi:hypothetical protein